MLKNNPPKTVSLVALVIVLVILPFVLKEYHLSVLTTLLIYSVVVIGFRLIVTTGRWPVGHICLMGAGAYASALMTKSLGWSFWLSLPLAGLIVAAVSLIMSYPLARTKGFAFFVASFGAGEAMRLCWIRFTVPFGGTRGLINIPAPESIPIPGLSTIDFSHPIPYYFIVLVVTLVCLMIMYRVDKSDIGTTFKAIDSNESLAKSVGINVIKYNMLAFVIGSTFAGIGGVLLAYQVRGINPTQFGFVNIMYLFVWVVVGGTRTFAGPIIGLTVLIVLRELLSPLEEWVLMIYGAILILTLLFLPNGLEDLPKRMSPLIKKIRMIGKGQKLI